MASSTEVIPASDDAKVVVDSAETIAQQLAAAALMESRHIPKSESTISYGALARNLESPSGNAETYYITTAIAYTNGYPHMGHAYEFLTADVIARFHRVMGYDTFFLTGSDEHGQKVAASAALAGRTPIDHCDLYVDAFKALNQRLAISCNDYQRTTHPYHEETARKLWCMCADAGDIYLDSYEGWYNEREEVFVPEAEAEAAQYLDPGSGTPLKKVSEESYFFRMSKYCDRLTQYIEENPSFVEPEQYRNNILARLRKDGLRDLSISRTSFTWGITMPKGFDDRHVMYVWFDALSNYLSGVHGLDPDHEDSRYWPAGR
jgi:methionyl-tRNA synthetase